MRLSGQSLVGSRASTGSDPLDLARTYARTRARIVVFDCQRSKTVIPFYFAIPYRVTRDREVERKHPARDVARDVSKVPLVSQEHGNY